MEDNRGKPRQGVPSTGATAAAGENTGQTSYIERNRSLGFAPPRPDRASESQEQFAIDRSSATNPQSLYRGDSHQRREHEAHAAFSANSEIIATTPRRTAWTQGHTLSTPFDDVQQSTDVSQQQISRSASPRAAEHLEGEWQPSLSIGSINAKELGAREAARRHMLQWSKIYDFNSTHNPGSAETVGKHMAEATRVYEELCTSERAEDLLPQKQLPSYQNDRIQARTTLLWKTFLEAPDEGCQPMKLNITAALNGYDTGSIGFSDNYTLIYAGHIVETTCKSHHEFTTDRQERLDKYFEQFGPGHASFPDPCDVFLNCFYENGPERAISRNTADYMHSSGLNHRSQRAQIVCLLRDARLLISTEKMRSTQESSMRTILATIKYLWVSRKMTV